MKEVNNKGYGRFSIFSDGGRRRRLAHRFAYELASGIVLDAGVVLLHSCDNPPCCNPAHLCPGTQQDNIADARAKGRMVAPPLKRGSDNSLSILDEDEVREIRLWLKLGFSQYDIATAYRVQQTTISRIHLRKSWVHVEDLPVGAGVTA